MRLFKQIATEQSKAAEHATAPTVNRIDGGLIHGLRRQMQAARRG